MAYDYDLFVIGAGSGGVRAARIAAAHGARVAIAEEHRYGGTCVIRGCIPKKLLVYAAGFAKDIDYARSYGWTVPETSFDWASLIAAKDREIERLSGLYRQTLDRVAVDMFDGRATLVDPHTVAIGGEQRTARYILVATGGRPFVPEMEGHEHISTSNEVFELSEHPKDIVIVGGGYIAVEFASIFRGLGSDVHLIYRRDQVLRGFDCDIREHLSHALAKRGIDMIMPANVEAIEQRESSYTLTLTDGRALHTELVVYATGRRPNTGDLGLSECGVHTGEVGEIVVDEHSQSSVENIYAVGDCTNRVALTPVAIREGHAVADNLFGGKDITIDYENIPTAVFSLPQVGTVGLQEHDAHARYGQVDLYRSIFRPLKATLTDDEERVMVKLIVAPAAGDRVVGLHVVGPDAAEIVQAAAVAIRMGATKADFDATVALHPTTAEELVLMREKVQPPLLKS